MQDFDPVETGEWGRSSGIRPCTHGVKISFAVEAEAPGVGPPEITNIRPPTSSRTKSTSCATSATSRPRWWRRCEQVADYDALIERLTEGFAKLKAGHALQQQPGGEWSEGKKYSGRARREPKGTSRAR